MDGRQGRCYFSFEYQRQEDPGPTPVPAAEPEQSLKPYSLVRPLLVSALRPVVLLPESLAPRLIRNLLDLPSSRLDFQVCPAESLSGEEQYPPSAPGAPKARPATPGLGNRIRAIQESVGKKHCLLELGARGIRELVQSDVYPIVIHVEVTEKNVREVRGLLGRPGGRDSELLRQCRSVEQALWGLPCSWVQVPAHAWGHAEELAKVKLPASRTLCLWPVGPFHLEPSLNFGLSNMGPLALGSHLSVICTLLRGCRTHGPGLAPGLAPVSLPVCHPVSPHSHSWVSLCMSVSPP